ncbi:MAG: PRC-barrel domain-containing protein [Candidatus Alkanophagales archaeon]
MKKVLTQKLMNMKVIDVEGSEIGRVRNIIADVRTGVLTDLVVEPEGELELDTSSLKRDGEFILVPFEHVRAVGDIITVELKRK